MSKDNKNGNSRLGISRRTLLQSAGVAAAGASFISFGGSVARAATEIRVQYDWLMGNGQIGDIVAKQKGFFEEEGLDVTFSPGGPNAQTVPPVLTGQAPFGQLSSTAQFFTAYGAGRPLKLIACGYRYSPYAYISLPKSAIRTPEDLPGKTIAINPNGRYMLDLIMKKNNLDRSTVKVVTMSTDMSPLISGQVDAVTGFITNTKALSVLGPDIVTMFPANTGVPNYANAYFTSVDAYDSQKENLQKFIRAVARGWGWSFENRKEAVDIMCDAYPTLDREIEYNTVDLVMSLSFDETTKANGWGWFDEERLTTQVELFKEIGSIPPDAVGVSDSVTWEILDETAGIRPKLG